MAGEVIQLRRRCRLCDGTGKVVVTDAEGWALLVECTCDRLEPEKEERKWNKQS